MYRTRQAAREAISSAPPFAVLQPRAFARVGTRVRGERWDMFLVDTEPSEAVVEQLELAGIDFVDFEPQRDDATAPRGFDDVDAAIQALGWGFWLVKVPDALMGPNAIFYRLYAVRAVEPRRQIKVS